MAVLRYALIILLVFLPASPFATTFPVTKTADTNDGTCDPDCSLREAIEAANANPGADDVPLPAGFYLLTLGQLVVSDEVSITGEGQTNTIIDGNATARVLDIEPLSGMVAISGVTIRNGVRSPFGGGIHNPNSDLILADSTVSGSHASVGGGIFGSATLINSTVSGNTASQNGGGISGDVTLINSTVSGNTASGYGGGIWGGSVALTNTTVSGNTALWGGGVAIAGHLTYSTLINSTISGNTAVVGGGVYLYVDWYYGLPDAASTNTIVSENNGYNCSSGIESLGYNLADDDSCFTEPGDLVVADAMLGPLQDNGGPTETHDLLPGSPAIDAGSPACPPPDTDQRGVVRPQGSACDIGAVEYLPEPGSSVMLVGGIGLLGLLYRRRRGAGARLAEGQEKVKKWSSIEDGLRGKGGR